MIQIKILYGTDGHKCKIKNVSNAELYQSTFDSFKQEIRKFIGGIFLINDEMKIEYRDDEGTFVTMTDKSDFEDALRYLTSVPNTDGTLRMVIKIGESTTPRSPVKKNCVLPVTIQRTSPCCRCQAGKNCTSI